MSIRGAVMFNVVKQSIRNFEHGLVGNILVRPMLGQRCIVVGDESEESLTGYQT